MPDKKTEEKTLLSIIILAMASSGFRFSKEFRWADGENNFHGHIYAAMDTVDMNHRADQIAKVTNN